MSYSIYKNKKLLKELSEKDYRLLKFNSKLINPFHTYLMYSLVPSELNELNFKDLNSVVEIFKKKINKFVKKKFNKNYVNANAQKDLDIFTELCHLNISIFNNNFDNLHSSTKNKKYTKRLYLINRDNDLFLLIKKDKKGLKLKLGNNVLKPIQSGGGEPAQKKAKTILAPMFRNNSHENYYYDQDKVNVFLRTYCEKLIEKTKKTDKLTDEMKNIGINDQQYKEKKKEKGKLNKEKLEHFKEIIIAAFTDYMRDKILELIKSIEDCINLKMYDNGKGIMGDDTVGKENPVRIVISGGSGFNNLIEKENRPISPDIDVKLCLHTNEAIDLHKHMTKGKYVANIKDIQMKVARQLLILRTHLFNVMEDKAKKFSKDIIEPRVEELNNMFKNLYKYCKTLMVEEMAGKDIPFLKSLDLNENEDKDGKWKKEFNENVKVLVRETLMKRGIDGDPKENNPYKLHDVFLYSLDLPFNKKSGFDSLAGILDIVVSIPGHIGYILPSYSNFQVKEGCYNITIDYYKYELIKLITYGLRTTNKKILKDLVRYKILLELEPNLEGPKLIDLKNIGQVIKVIEDNTLRDELEKLLSDSMNVGLNDNLEITDEDLIVIQSDTQDSDEHLINLDEQCSSQEDVISQTSEDSEYDQKMRQMYIDLYADIDENGSLNKFVSDCVYHGMCGYSGGSKKKKQIGGIQCGNVEMLSLSKVFQLMVNNKSMKGFINFNNIKLVPDKNETHKYLTDIINKSNLKKSIHNINFEKLTESKAKYSNNNVKSKLNDYITDEYLSTKASSRVSPFRISKKDDFLKKISDICEHLIKVIKVDKNINTLCYCYENEDYKPEPGNPNVPSEQEYAAFLLTQCQVLNTIDVTQELYKTIAIKAGVIRQEPSRVNPTIETVPPKTTNCL